MLRPVVTILLTLSLVFLWKTDRGLSDHRLVLAMLDVGQGDALFIQSPTGTQVLIDAGPPRKILGQLSRVMPAFDRTIDAVILTHPDTDHIGGLKDIEREYKIENLFEPGIYSKEKISGIIARRGMRIKLGGGAAIDILFPDTDVYDWETNAGGIVAKLSYGNTSVLLSGDAPIEMEKKILGRELDSDILKIGHHGSKTSSSAEFIRAVSPKYALISVGKDNKYGHPDQSVLHQLSGIPVLRTDLMGIVVLRSDGEKWFLPFAEKGARIGS